MSGCYLCGARLSLMVAKLKNTTAFLAADDNPMKARLGELVGSQRFCPGCLRLLFTLTGNYELVPEEMTEKQFRLSGKQFYEKILDRDSLFANCSDERLAALLSDAIDSRLISFTSECTRNGVTGAVSDYEQQKAVLLAKRHQIPPEFAVRVFLAGKDAAGAKQAREAEQQLHNRLQEYRDTQAMNESFSSLPASEKTAAMLDYDLLINMKRYSKLRGMDENILDSFNALKQREVSWAVMGGIADGIAGPAAGVMAALNTQANNRAKQAYNANVDKLATMAAMHQDQKNWERARPYYLEIERLKKKKTEMAAKVLQEKDTKELWGLLNVTLEPVRKISDGCVQISLRVVQRDPALIYEKQPAYVDGSLTCTVTDGSGRSVTSIRIPLPVDGVDTSCIVDGYAFFDIPKHPGPYRVAVLPNHLWLVER